jgi:hypothetical protein
MRAKHKAISMVGAAQTPKSRYYCEEKEGAISKFNNYDLPIAHSGPNPTIDLRMYKNRLYFVLRVIIQYSLLVFLLVTSPSKGHSYK